MHERLKLLESFGFIEIAPSGDQKFGLVFLPNPNIVLLNLWDKKRSQGSGPYDPPGLGGLQETTMSAFLERAIDIGANDVTRMHAKLNAAQRGGEEAEEPKKVPKIRRPPKPSKG